MKGFTVLAAALLAGVVTGQNRVTESWSSIPSAPVPTAPPLSNSDVIEYIGNIPSCWAPCVGGAIKELCGSEDSWDCACAADENTGPGFIQLVTYDSVCRECSPNLGPSDGGEQDISGLLFNICIALPDALATSIASALGTLPTTTPSPHHTENAAAMVALQQWQLVVLPFVGMALF